MTVADRIDAPTQLLGGGRVVTPDGVLSDAWVEVSDGRITQIASVAPRPGCAGRRSAGRLAAAGLHRSARARRRWAQRLRLARGDGAGGRIPPRPRHHRDARLARYRTRGRAPLAARVGRRARPPRPDAARPRTRLTPRGPIPVSPPVRRAERGAHAAARPGAAWSGCEPWPATRCGWSRSHPSCRARCR